MYRTIALRLIIIAFVLLSISTSSLSVPIQRLDPVIADSLAQMTDDPLVRADYYSRAWLNEKALSALEASGHEDAEVLWRLARSRIDMGENLEGDAALALYDKAMDEAQRAVDLDSKNALAQQTLAVACGRVALFKGVFKSLGLVKRVHEAALRAAAESDSVPIALYVLGKTHKKLIEKPALIRKPLGLGWANEDSVAYYFKRALEVSQNNMIQCFVEYAEFLVEEGDKQNAKIMFESAIALPLRDEQDGKAKDRAREMLKTL